MDLGLSEVRDLVVPVPVIRAILEEVTCAAQGNLVAAGGTCESEEDTCVAGEGTCVSAAETFVVFLRI